MTGIKKRISRLGPLIASILVAGNLLSSCVTTENPHYMIKSKPKDDVVQLRYATLPSALRVLSIHYWFAVYNTETAEWSRWEVWHEQDAGGENWGYVHKDLMHPDSGVGGGPYVIGKEWRGKTARDIIAIVNMPLSYPHHKQYRAWSGPNSNTYAAWVLRQAQVSVDMHPKAIGKDYVGVVGAAVSTTKTGVQVESPLLGLKAGLRDGLEIHLFCFTIGLDLWPPALKTPVGRLGFAEPSSWR